MKQNDFYEVDGCMDFIPVTIDETYADSVAVTVDNYMQGYRLVVKEVYRFPKANEPQKVVIPKFVAQWYEKNRDDLNNAIYDAIIKSYRKVNGENDDFLDKFQSWLVYEDNSILILVQMQLFGYVVEQEKLYTVEIPNPVLTDNSDSVTVLMKLDLDVVLTDVVDYIGRQQEHVYQLTEAEIKKDFEWAWQFAKPVEENNGK